MIVKILAIGDTANVISVLRKFVKKSKIDHIQFKSAKISQTINFQNDTMFFHSENVFDQVNQLLSMKSNYDFFLVTNWSTARLAYLVGANYVWMFNGDDIRHPFFAKDSYFNYNYNFLERAFYRRVFDSVSVYVAPYHEVYDLLKKYVDPVLIHALIDTDAYNPDVKPIDPKKKKFTFLSPQRISYEKGTEIIWNALSKCKSDFEVLQVEWFDNFPPQLVEKSKRLLTKKPSNVRLIPIIKNKDMPKYYAFADAIIGEMRKGYLNNIEREAAACKKPVIAYTNPEYKFEIDGKLVSMPFYPKSIDPNELAVVIDATVNSKEFREKITEEGFEFVNQTSNPLKQAEKYDKLFKMLKDKQNLKRKSAGNRKLRKMLFIAAHYSNVYRMFSNTIKKIVI